MTPAFDVLGIGLNATDTLLIVREFPEYAGKALIEEELLSPGGQVATAIVACARLGLRTKYVGTVGDDLRGRVQRESLSGTGVDTAGVIVRAGCPNQSAYIVIDRKTGERTVFWRRSECLRLQAREIRREDIASARMLHIDGYDVDAAAWAAAEARRLGIPVSLDVDTVYAGFDAVLDHVDYLVAGSGWPAKWTGEGDAIEALQMLRAQHGFRVAAMTLGEHGAVALSDEGWTYSPGFHVTSVDTTGAGDVFHGAFCYAMLQGMRMREALEFSNAAAALNCTAIGARGHVPAVSEVRALIESGAERIETEQVAERVGAAAAGHGRLRHSR